MIPNPEWRARNYKKQRPYAGAQYRKAGERLDPAQFQKARDAALVAAQDAFGDRFEIIPGERNITIGAKLEQPGLSPQQLALSQLQKRNTIEGGRENVRTYELTPDDINIALVKGAELGIFDNASINRIISGGGVDITNWADKVRQRKFGETGQEFGSGIDVVTGGPIVGADIDKGHIFAGNKHEHMRNFPENTRAEYKYDNRAFGDAEGTALEQRVDNRLYGPGVKGAAFAVGQQNIGSTRMAALVDNAKTKGGKIQDAPLRKAIAAEVRPDIDELDAMLVKQRIVDSLPFEKQGPAMLALGMVEPSDIL